MVLSSFIVVFVQNLLEPAINNTAFFYVLALGTSLGTTPYTDT
jgi:hypothetical protein